MEGEKSPDSLKIMLNFETCCSWRNFINTLTPCLQYILSYLGLFVASAHIIHEYLSFFASQEHMLIPNVNSLLILIVDPSCTSIYTVNTTDYHWVSLKSPCWNSSQDVIINVAPGSSLQLQIKATIRAGWPGWMSKIQDGSYPAGTSLLFSISFQFSFIVWNFPQS